MKGNRTSREPKPNLKHKRPQRSPKPSSLDKDNPFRELPRIRSIKPEFFVHLGLFDAERAYGLPLRVAFMGLITCCDRKGCFRWQPRRLKLYTLPYDEVDMGLVLEALLEEGFIQKYEHQDQWYGVIPSFLQHQKITASEPQSPFPMPQESFSESETASQHCPIPQKNLGSETHFEDHFSSSFDKNFDGKIDPHFVGDKNLGSETQVVDENFQKKSSENSLKPSSFAPPECTTIKHVSENRNKNNEIGAFSERKKNEDQTQNFQKKKIYF